MWEQSGVEVFTPRSEPQKKGRSKKRLPSKRKKATIQVTMEERQFRRRTTVTLYASLLAREGLEEEKEGGKEGKSFERGGVR